MLLTSCLLLLPKSHKPQSYQIQVCISQDFMYFPPPSLFPCKLLCSNPLWPYLTPFKIVTHRSSTKPNVTYPNWLHQIQSTYRGLEVNWSFFSTQLNDIASSHTSQIELQVDLKH